MRTKQPARRYVPPHYLTERELALLLRIHAAGVAAWDTLRPADGLPLDVLQVGRFIAIRQDGITTTADGRTIAERFAC